MKTKLAVLLGGRSGEHEVSVMSAGSILAAIDRDLFDVVPIGITRTGRWLLLDDPQKVLAQGRVEEGDGNRVFLAPEPCGGALLGEGMRTLERVDVVFPALHGPFGEDGTVQGLLEMACVPCVGAGVLASSVGMDKAVMKELFKARGIPVAEFRVIARRTWETDPGATIRQVEDLYGYPVFVKPANLGSSVGVSKVSHREGLRAGLDLAFRYDLKAVVEKAVQAREIECSVLGNEEPVVSVPGEIIPSREFYDYHAKYIDGTSGLIIPADLEPGVTQSVKDLAIRAFQAIDCSGMARVDFFVTPEAVLVNEINTIPGFTSLSMYPKLWASSGLCYTDLISRLVALALERHQARSTLLTTYDPHEREDSTPES